MFKYVNVLLTNVWELEGDWWRVGDSLGQWRKGRKRGTYQSMVGALGDQRRSETRGCINLTLCS